MSSSRRDFLYAGLLTVGVLTLYGKFLSKAYVFEGLIRALPIETGRWGHLFPGNYLLYGPLGLTFHTLLNILGLQHPAVISLQMMDALIGAAGVFIFYFILRRLGGDPLLSTAGALLLASSLGYWMWSTEAENYILSTVLLMIHFFFLLNYYRQKRPDPLLVGAIYGCAILGHIVNVLIGAVGLWFFFATHGRQGWRPALRYAGAAFVVAGAAYGAVLIFIQKPESLHQAIRWFAGSAGRGEYDITLGGGYSWDKLQSWLKMSLRIFTSFSPAYNAPAGWAFAGSLLLAARALILLFLGSTGVYFKRMTSLEQAVGVACVVWLAIYAVMFTSWEPGTMVYRVSDLIPLCILIFMGIRQLAFTNKAWRYAAVGLSACLLVGNLGAEIYPRSFEANNPHLARMRFIAQHTLEGDWVTGHGAVDEIYIPYFAHRRPLVVGRYTQQPQALRRFIQDLIDRQESVYVTSRVLQDSRWQTFFSDYGLAVKARDAADFTLFQVRKYHGTKDDR